MAEELPSQESTRVTTVGEAMQKFSAFFVGTWDRMDLVPAFKEGQSNDQWRQLSPKMFLGFSFFGYTIMTPGKMGTFQSVHLDRKDYDQPLDAASQALVETVLQACAECEKGEFLAQELADRRAVARELVHSVGGAC